jgi:two-component system CheB/CheR fusion protein
LQKGARVTEAASAEEALELAAAGHFDLIVSDIAMPVTDGYAMMRQLRRRPGRFIPAIALTACVTPDDIATALSAGYQRYLPKPLNAAALIQTAAEVAVAARTSAPAQRRPSTVPSHVVAQPSPTAEV